MEESKEARILGLKGAEKITYEGLKRDAEEMQRNIEVERKVTRIIAAQNATADAVRLFSMKAQDARQPDYLIISTAAEKLLFPNGSTYKEFWEIPYITVPDDIVWIGAGIITYKGE